MKTKNQYPENWADEIRPNILRRDGYKCRRCKVAHRQRQAKRVGWEWFNIDKAELNFYTQSGYQTRTVYLQVAHLNHVKMDCAPDNLVTWCPTCHHANDAMHKTVMRIGNLCKPQSS
jgi:hypothetical protein